MIASEWQELRKIPNRRFDCGSCGTSVASDRGYSGTGWRATERAPIYAYECPNCSHLTIVDAWDRQFPGPFVGKQVGHLPENVDSLWSEALQCMSVGSTTASAMICRVLLMHVAVDKGAEGKMTFAECVNWLADNAYFTPDTKMLIERIREIGNTANHDLVVINFETARTAMVLTEHLLKSVYELPGNHSGTDNV